jgi:hypothetical protein
MRALPTVARFVALSAVLVSCNALFDIQEGELADDPICTLTSECQKNQVCLFERCSAPCNADVDCAEGRRCVSVADGRACVRNEQAACKNERDCPAGLFCGSDGTCRNGCDDPSDCLAGQQCRSSTCFGSDPDHDPALVGADGGSNGGTVVTPSPNLGEGGDGGKGGTASTGSPGASEAGSGGETEPAAQGGSAGTVEPGPGGAPGSGGSVEPPSGGSGGTEPPPPPPGCEQTARCADADSIEYCDDGVFSTPVSCPFGCQDDRCNECEPGTRTCLTGAAHVCLPEGVYDAGTVCPVLCDNGQCATECSAGALQCDRDTPQACTNGAWVSGEPCEFECLSGACTECVRGETRCTDDLLSSCGSTGTWSEPEECTYVCRNERCTGVCEPGTRKCLDEHDYQICGADGTYDTSARTCENQACYRDACAGSCSPGELSCSNGNVFRCDNTGQRQPFQQCNPPDDYCMDGECVDNRPYVIGNESPAFTTNASVSGGQLYLFRLGTANANADVLELGILGGGNNGVTARLALYEDDGSGLPGVFVARTGDITVNTVAGTSAPVPPNAGVVSGRTYWIGAVFSGTPQMKQRTASGAVAYRMTMMYTDTFPTTFAPTGTQNNVEWNLWLRVQNRVPP